MPRERTKEDFLLSVSSSLQAEASPVPVGAGRQTPRQPLFFPTSARCTSFLHFPSSCATPAAALQNLIQALSAGAPLQPHTSGGWLLLASWMLQREKQSWGWREPDYTVPKPNLGPSASSPQQARSLQRQGMACGPACPFAWRMWAISRPVPWWGSPSNSKSAFQANISP